MKQQLESRLFIHSAVMAKYFGDQVMPGTIGTYRDPDNNEVRAMVTHDGTAFVLADNDGQDAFGGRYVAQEPASSSIDAALSPQPDHLSTVSN